MKPGYKTTEFWLSVVAMVVGSLIASGAFSDSSLVMQGLGVAAVILGQLGYAVPRAGLKKIAEPTLEWEEDDPA